MAGRPVLEPTGFDPHHGGCPSAEARARHRRRLTTTGATRGYPATWPLAGGDLLRLAHFVFR